MDENKLKSLSRFISGMEIKSPETDAWTMLDSITTYPARDIPKHITADSDLSAFRKSVYAAEVREVMTQSELSKFMSSGLFHTKPLIAEDNKLTLDELRIQAEALGYKLVKIDYESTDLTGTNKIKLN